MPIGEDKSKKTLSLFNVFNGIYTSLFGNVEESDADKVWLEERTRFNKREIRDDPNWQDGKTLYEQIETIIDQKALPYRIWDFAGLIFRGDNLMEKLWHTAVLPIGFFAPCLLYGCAEYKAGVSPDWFWPSLKCLVCCPGCSCCWMPGHLRMLIKEAHEVPGDRYFENILHCWSAWGNYWMCGFLNISLYMNAKAIESNSWFRPEIQGDFNPLSIQKQFIDWDEDVKLD